MVAKGVTKPANLCACSDCHGPTQFGRWFETSTAYAVNNTAPPDRHDGGFDPFECSNARLILNGFTSHTLWPRNDFPSMMSGSWGEYTAINRYIHIYVYYTSA